MCKLLFPLCTISIIWNAFIVIYDAYVTGWLHHKDLNRHNPKASLLFFPNYSFGLTLSYCPLLSLDKDNTAFLLVLRH
jgi:hypothetical protein